VPSGQTGAIAAGRLSERVRGFWLIMRACVRPPYRYLIEHRQIICRRRLPRTYLL
jgi:hypothetical protein